MCPQKKAMKKNTISFFRDPVNQFIKLETSSSIILFVAAFAALVLANSSIGIQFLDFWKDRLITIAIPGIELSKPIYKWINDGLMAVFFFLIGLEIKREILSGELSHIKKASLPIFAAIGGMVVPALMFTFLNRGNAGGEGWGIPMAADIAFALGILTLLGKRVPSGLKIFVMAFAIIDDLGAVLVIAFFYSQQLIWSNIFIGLAIVGTLFLLARFNYYSKYLFFIAGVVVWVLFLKSGIHATIAGVLLAMTIPLKRRIDTLSFYERGKELLEEFKHDCEPGEKNTVLTRNQMHTIDELTDITETTTSPLQHLEHALHGWVSYLIIPIFAFANAGVIFSFSGDMNVDLSANIAISMVVGNFLGIFTTSWLAIKFNLAELPQSVNFKQLAGVSFLGGLGFTMSLFINDLAYSSELLIDSAKMGILFGSVIAGLLGYFAILLTTKSEEK